MLHLHPHGASPVFLMDKVTLSVSLPLPGALHGTDQLSILPSVLRSGIMHVVCLVLAGFHPKELPQEVFPPGSAWIWGEWCWEGRNSRQMLSRLPALGLCWWRIVTSTSMDAACSPHTLQGKILGGCCC